MQSTQLAGLFGVRLCGAAEAMETVVSGYRLPGKEELAAAAPAVMFTVTVTVTVAVADDVRFIVHVYRFPRVPELIVAVSMGGVARPLASPRSYPCLPACLPALARPRFALTALALGQSAPSTPPAVLRAHCCSVPAATTGTAVRHDHWEPSLLPLRSVARYPWHCAPALTPALAQARALALGRTPVPAKTPAPGRASLP